MNRYLLLTLIFAITAIGCGKSKPRTAAEDEETRKAVIRYAREKLPVLDRTIVMQELEQIHLYYYTAYTASGKWPKSMNEAKAMMQRDPDMRKLLAKIDDGTYVVVGNPPEGGILAYCSKPTTIGFIYVTTGKDFDQYKTMDELKAKLAEQRR